MSEAHTRDFLLLCILLCYVCLDNNLLENLGNFTLGARFTNVRARFNTNLGPQQPLLPFSFTIIFYESPAILLCVMHMLKLSSYINPSWSWTGVYRWTVVQ